MDASSMRYVRALVVAIACHLVPVTTVMAGEPLPPAPPAQPAQPEADRLFEEGVAARKAGKLAEAEELFRKAWGLKKTWDIAANLGLAELNLGKLPEGSDHVYYAITELPPTESNAMRDKLVQAFKAGREDIAGIDVHCNVEGAEVLVDGKSKGTTPLRRTFFTMPGQVIIEVRKDGYVTERKTFSVKKASSQQYEFSLVKKAVPGEQPERSMVPPAIAFGIGGAGLVLGAIGGGIASAKFDEIKTLCGESLVCPESARGTYDAANMASYLSTAGFIVAGAGAAVGVTLLLLPVRQKTSARIDVSVGPAFVGVKGSF